MKKMCLWLAIVISFIILTGCSQKNDIKITSTNSQSGDWLIHGSVKAQSGEIVVGVLKSKYAEDQIIYRNADDDTVPPTIKNNKFKGVVSGIGSASEGENATVYLDVVDNDFLDNNEMPEILSKKQIKEIKENGTKISLKTSKKQIQYWGNLDDDTANESSQNDDSYSENLEDASNSNLDKNIKSEIEDGFSGLTDVKVTVDGQTSVEPYNAGIEIYDKDFMDLELDKNSIVDVFDAIRSLDNYDKFDNITVTYFADLQNSKGAKAKRTKILSFDIAGSDLKGMDTANMSISDVKDNVSNYWEQDIK